MGIWTSVKNGLPTEEDGIFFEVLVGHRGDIPITQIATYNLRNEDEGWVLFLPGNWHIRAWRPITTPDGWQQFFPDEEQ